MSQVAHRILLVVGLVVAALACADIDDPVPDTMRHVPADAGARDARDSP